MQFPYTVIQYLPPPLAERWNTFFAGEDHDRQRYVEEGIWRRTQDEANADQSGWSGAEDARRRIVHYRNQYALAGTRLVLVDWYLYYCVSYPAREIAEAAVALGRDLTAGGWSPAESGEWVRGDLRCHLVEFERHPQDEYAGRRLPLDYRSLEVVLTSAGFTPDTALRNRPWDVLAGGIRVKDTRGEPTITPDLSALAQFLPFQVEVGCGTSVEAGIPPLHRLHEIYRVTDRSDNIPGTGDPFILDAVGDVLLHEVLATPRAKFGELVEMFTACFLAEATPALTALAALADAGHLVGPVITNNFDVLCARAGLGECFVRRYDERIPDVPILPQARSLLVVGNHADRRKVQARFRAAGLPIFFLDPEGFHQDDGSFIPYPLESALTGDRVCHQTAAEGLPALVKILGLEPGANRAVASTLPSPRTSGSASLDQDQEQAPCVSL